MNEFRGYTPAKGRKVDEIPIDELEVLCRAANIPAGSNGSSFAPLVSEAERRAERIRVYLENAAQLPTRFLKVLKAAADGTAWPAKEDRSMLYRLLGIPVVQPTHRKQEIMLDIACRHFKLPKPQGFLHTVQTEPRTPPKLDMAATVALVPKLSSRDIELLDLYKEVGSIAGVAKRRHVAENTMLIYFGHANSVLKFPRRGISMEEKAAFAVRALETYRALPVRR